MKHLLQILKGLGPGYWAEMRYFGEALEISLYFRYPPEDLIIRKVLRLTDEFLLKDPHEINMILIDLVSEIQTVVKSKMS